MLKFLLLMVLAATAALQEPATLLDNVCPPGSTINLTNTRIVSIGPGFGNDPRLTCLDLKDNTIESVAADAFESLPNLKELYISNNKINSLTELFSSSMLQLEVLDVTSNRQTYPSVDQYITGRFPALRTFSLSHNSIKTIVAEIPFPKLERLDLSRNSFINALSLNTIALDTLEHLNMSANRMETFSGMDWSNLTTLDLSRNSFTGISYKNVGRSNATLVGLKSLRELYLGTNNIIEIEEDAFTDTVNLEILDLQLNRLNSLRPDVFLPLKSLKFLRLRNNRGLKEIPRFQEISTLTTLDIGAIGLTTVGPDAFWWGVDLKLLRLDDNSIETVYANSFSGLGKLEVLDLSSNSLSILPAEWCAQLTSLRYLDLKDNSFASLESVGMSDNVPLLYLFLEGNRLSFLKQSSFSSIPENVTINLSNIRPTVPILDIITE